MQISRAKLSRMFLNVFFVYASLATIVVGLMMTRVNRKWIISDWLINYQGGFVRRGLPGEVAFHLSRLLHITPVFFAPLFYLSVYAILFACIWNLALNSSRSFWVFALILSPASISLQFLHPNAGYRKEVLILAALSLFVILLRRFHISSFLASAYMTVLCVVGTLSHEGVVLYAPYFIAALVVGGRTLPQALRLCVYPFIAGVIAFSFCVTHLGNIHTADQICASLGYKLPTTATTADEICANGAIGYLQKTREQAGAEALDIIVKSHYLRIFGFFIPLALIPAIGESASLSRAGLNRKVRVMWLSAGLSLLATLILFRYGVDWGRWVYVHIMCITILLLFIDGREQGASSVDEEGAKYRKRNICLKEVVCGVLLLAYSTLWILPNAGEPLRLGYIGLALSRIHHGSRGGSKDLND